MSPADLHVPDVPDVAHVEAYAERIRAALDGIDAAPHDDDPSALHRADARRRLQRDVEGLRDCWDYGGPAMLLVPDQRDHALRCWTDLCELGALYGVLHEVPCEFHCDTCGSDTHDALVCGP